MKPLFLFISIFILLRLDAQQKNFQHFTTTQGLSYSTVFDIAQDNSGFIWIATGEGLNRFDSYRFKIYYTGRNPGSIPSNEVRSLLVTRKGKLFAGTTDGLCIYNPEYNNFSRILYNEHSLGLIHDIIETSKGRILITSSTGVFYISQAGKIEERLSLENGMMGLQEDSAGNFWSFKRLRLFNFDKQGKLLQTLYSGDQGLPGYIPSPISTIKIDSHNQLWIGTFRDGPLLLDVTRNKFRSIPLKIKTGKTHPMYFVRDIAEINGKYWIGTEKGLFIYDPKQESFEHYTQSFDPTLASINDNAIYKIFRSHENIIWLGTYFGGLNLYQPVSRGFKNIKPGIKPGELKGKALSQIIKGPDGKLWIATEDAGIAIYDPQHNTFRHILNEQPQNNLRSSSNVHALAMDREGNVWSGNFFGGINKINPVSFQVRNYSHDPDRPESLVNNFVFSLYFDNTDKLWIGTMDGIDCYEKKTDSFSHFKPELLRGKFIYDIFQDREQNYWFCSHNDFGLYRYNPNKDEISHFQKDSTEGISGNSFIGHLVDSRGKIWFGSRGGGLTLFDPVTGKFKSFTMDDGLPNNVIYGILEDDHHNLWLSSNKGISKFNHLTGEIRNFTVDHGLVGNQFNYKSYLKTDSIMYFGTVNGLTFFKPDQIKVYKSEPKIHFTDFKLFNQPVKPGKKSILKKDIDLTSHITLDYDENVISFDFIALDFHSPGKNNFFYYMDGFESTWQSAGNNQSVTYTDLPAGEYTFRIKATNIYNFPNTLERSIRITVRPPVWLTTWAFLFYILLTGTVIFLLYRFNEIRHREKMALKIEKIEKEKLREIHQHKLNFFTYISHEFKTPLTIILASIDAFFSGEKYPDHFTSKIITLKRNVLRLQFLINQLMDFRKIETDHAVSDLQYGNVIQFLKELFDAFTTLFKRKELQYSYITQCESLLIKFDPDKLEQIVSNLLSNAFKYTPEKGKIIFKTEVTREEEKQLLVITVSNTGNEMTEEQLSKIFNLFYKIENDQNEYHGSGIGLTLTRSLVNFLNGAITVESKQGEGITFTVKLPFTEEVQRDIVPNTFALKKSIIENLMIQSSPENIDFEPDEITSDLEIFFVEDNNELLKFLNNQFRGKYKITALLNGLEAWNQLQKTVPDIIVTDLMMPQMDGLTLCKNLKSSFEFSHIPVIMLTAKGDIESKLESLEVGADVYLPKPFLLSELELQIKNILTAKANLKKHFLKFGQIDIEHPLKNRDQQFIEKTTSIILANIENPDFGISTLTTELGIGRTLLHTKLKQIVDLSATEFINTVRLKEAQRKLIENPELTMSEIAYKVGFNDPNYFSRTFRKIFNISPSDFRNEKMNEPKTI